MCGQCTKIYFLTLFYSKFESENYFQGLLTPLQKKKKLIPVFVGFLMPFGRK